MKKLKNLILGFVIIPMSFAACSSTNEHPSQQQCVINGIIVANNDESFVLSSAMDTICFPKSSSLSVDRCIFLHDSVSVRYTVSSDSIFVNDVILLAHKDNLDNVSELFVGTWSSASSSDIVLHADKTTGADGRRWCVNGNKMLFELSDTAEVYDIVRVDMHEMTLCRQDEVFHFRRRN